MIRIRARRPLLAATAVLGAAVLGAGSAVGGYAVTAAVHHRTATPPAARAASPQVLAEGAAAPAASPTPAGTPASAARVAAALAGPSSAAALGPRLTALVLDVASGTTLYSRQPTLAVAPASTAKLLTAAAVLTVHRPTDTFTTRVVAGPGTAVTLVGGGDPTITGATAGTPGYYRGAARLSDLAAALRAAKLTPSRIYVDDSAFTGPTVSPAWAAEDVPSSYASPITAVMVDGGRASATDTILSDAPDLAAGQALARLLGTPSVPVARGRAPSAARTLASVRSAPLRTLVTEMLQLSDNVIAETLGRQVARAEAMTASFTGAAAAIRQVVRRIGLDPGAGMVDASGLAARDRLSALTLAGLARLLAGADDPDLHVVVSALPVAAWSGTLADRYLSGASRSGAGLVRAKTGTLTGVSTLAGLVRDRSGRLLAFALLTDRAPSTPAADAALDRIAARLAACGCA